MNSTRLPDQRSLPVGVADLILVTPMRITSLVLLALTMVSCDSKFLGRGNPLSGQIFVVLENRETLKLSLTDICIITPEEAKAVLNQLSTQRDEAVKHFLLSKYLNDRLRLDASKQVAKMKTPGASEFDKVLGAGTVGDSLGRATGGPPLTGSPSEVAQLEQIVADDSATFREINRLAQYTLSVRVSNAMCTTTDVDGKFTLPVSREERIMFAVASRRIGSLDERYCWMVRIPASAATIQLTNKNMADTDDAENVARDAYRVRQAEPKGKN